MIPRFFPTSADFRRWLKSESHKTPELWVGYYKKSSDKPSISYPESVDEALCFGWIDGVRKSIDVEAYTIRFTPRKPKSQWSAVNIRRVQELATSGRMMAAGRKAFEGAEEQGRKYAYEQRHQAKLSKADERRFRANTTAWEYFQAQARWYRHTATYWIISAKKEETRQRRLATLMDDCAHQRPLKGLTRPLPKWQKKPEKR